MLFFSKCLYFATQNPRISIIIVMGSTNPSKQITFNQSIAYTYWFCMDAGYRIYHAASTGVGYNLHKYVL